jgi:UDPglucose 6-dehydrogenase
MAKICMIGTGYVGLVSGACLADFGHTVHCVDIDASRIAKLSEGEIPIYEPGLKDVVKRNVESGRLYFTTNLEEAVKASEVVFMAVGTPPLDDGGTDLSFVTAAAEGLAPSLSGYKVIVQKSTVPVGSARKLAEIIRKHAPRGAEFDVVSNPEFLREGSAIEDFMRPNRVVIGAETDRAREMMREVYRPLYLLETPIVSTTIETAEMIKYVSNACLATKISFINEIASICELVGANVDEVAKGIGLDGRIGTKFLHAGIGYGGSCLPKDVASFLHVAADHGFEPLIVSAAQRVNSALVDHAMEKLERALSGIKGKTVGLLGLAFKPNTDDLREAPSLRVADWLAAAGAKIKAYDPIAVENFKRATKAEIEYCKNAYDCADASDALMLLTEWNEFRELDFVRLGKLMKKKVFIDCRNVYKPERVISFGFTYDSFGRGSARAPAGKE